MAVATAAASALGEIGGSRARESLLERLHSDSSTLWGPCAEALETDGWLPVSPIDIVRAGAAKADWTESLALGANAVDELRAVLHIGNRSMRRGAATTLHTLGWKPHEPNSEWFDYVVARADWETEEHQHPGQRPSLLAWFNAHPLSRGPVRALVEELLSSLTVPLAGKALEDALRDDDLLRRYVATIAVGVAHHEDVVPLLLANLNAPDDDAHRWFDYGKIRVASAQALGGVKYIADVVSLLKHAASGIRSGVSVYGNTSAVAAVQAAWRSVELSDMLEHIPALALGRRREYDSKHFVFDLWACFPLDLSALERFSVSALVEGLVNFDRSKLPAFSMLYTDMAFWELQTRLAVLALVCMAGATESSSSLIFGPLKSAVVSALEHMPSHSVEPVLCEAEHWGGLAVRDFAQAELRRREQAEGAPQPVEDQSLPSPPSPH
jgi:HEAT repeat protein